VTTVDVGKGAGGAKTKICRPAEGHGRPVRRRKGGRGRAVERAREKLQADGRAAIEDASTVGDGGFTPQLRFLRVKLTHRGNLLI
jgi:hypothetical protein